MVFCIPRRACILDRPHTPLVNTYLQGICLRVCDPHSSVQPHTERSLHLPPSTPSQVGKRCICYPGLASLRTLHCTHIGPVTLIPRARQHLHHRPHNVQTGRMYWARIASHSHLPRIRIHQDTFCKTPLHPKTRLVYMTWQHTLSAQPARLLIRLHHNPHTARHWLSMC